MRATSSSAAVNPYVNARRCSRSMSAMNPFQLSILPDAPKVASAHPGMGFVTRASGTTNFWSEVLESLVARCSSIAKARARLSFPTRSACVSGAVGSGNGCSILQSAPMSPLSMNTRTSGAPQSGGTGEISSARAGTRALTAFISEATRRTPSSGSMSPTRMTTIRSGRYHAS